MNEKEKITAAFSQVKAPADTLDRVHDRITQEKGKKTRSFAVSAAIVAAVLVLSCVGAFAAVKFGISPHVLPGDTPSAAAFSITTPFGNRESVDGYASHHDGIDFAAPLGTPVLAAADGTVIETAFDDADGNYVKVQHADGYVTIYKCLNEYTVAEGDTVSQGQQLGAVGSTGHSTGPHLHFELRQNGTPIDPALYFTD